MVVGPVQASRVARRGAADIERLKQAGQIVGETLQLLQKRIEPGVTGAELDSLAEKYIRSRGALPSFKGYKGYPATICMETEDIVVHGIPDATPLKEGQIVGIDLGVCYLGFHGDGAFSTVSGEADEKRRKLVAVTRQGLMAGLKQARAGKKLKAISRAVQEYVEGQGFSIVRELVGHGIGAQMHEPPQIPNFWNEGEFADYELELQPGMVLAIEPMVNAGGAQVEVDEDGWTVRTSDGQPSAHFEHTIVVTEAEPLVLTLAEGARYLSNVQ